MKKFSLRTLIILALLAAIAALLKAYFTLQIAPAGLKAVDVSLTPIPVMLAGIFFGPGAGFLTGFVADTAGFFMGVQIGPYNPLFSITMGLFGVIAGLFYLKSPKNTILKTTLVSASAQVVVSIFFNTLIVWLYYGVSLTVLLPTRLLSAAVELPVYAWLLMLLIEALKPLVKRIEGVNKLPERFSAKQE